MLLYCGRASCNHFARAQALLGSAQRWRGACAIAAGVIKSLVVQRQDAKAAKLDHSGPSTIPTGPFTIGTGEDMLQGRLCRPTCSAHSWKKFASKWPVLAHLSKLPFPAAAGVKTRKRGLCALEHHPTGRCAGVYDPKVLLRDFAQLHAHLGHLSWRGQSSQLRGRAHAARPMLLPCS